MPWHISIPGSFPSRTRPTISSSVRRVCPINVRDDVVRVDHRINDKYQILAHYMHDSVSQAFPSPMVGWSGGSWPTITSTLNNPSNSAAVKLTATISPNLLVEASMNYDGNIIDIVNSSVGQLAGRLHSQQILQQRLEVRSEHAIGTASMAASRRIQVRLPGTTLQKTSSPRWMFPTP